MSYLVDYHLQPLVHKRPSFVKDTNDFLNKLLTIGKLPAHFLLVTLDVSSLYTVLISHIMKVLMLVSIFYVLPHIILFPLAHSVTSFA